VKIEIDGDTLELSEVSAAEPDRLVDLFVGRHARNEGLRDGRRKALIVANDQYENDGLRHLLSPGADAEALARGIG
jgi:hypothetical protein